MPAAPIAHVLVTGVSGFVGAAVARALAAAGYRVRGLARATSPTANLRDFPGEIVEGDLLDKLAIERAMTGCDSLVHVAADYRLWAPDETAIFQTNVEGTRNVMAAALVAGVRRIVHTSSVATIAPDPNGPADEDRPLAPDQAIGAYKRSKVEAERRVEGLVARDGLPAVIVNPSTPIGPRDAAHGRIPAFVDTGLNLVHVDDVAAGHVAALEHGQPGRRYILGGQDVTLQDMLAEIARRTGRRPPRIRLPRTPLYPLALVSEAIARATGKEPLLTRDALAMAKHRMFFSSARAEHELGYRARPYDEAISGALAWFAAEGML